MDRWFPAPVIASLQAAADRPALQTGSRTITRGALLAMVRRIMTGLREAGLGPGSGLGRDFGGEFVVAAAEVLDERMTSGDSCGGAEAFESAHRPQPGLQPTMIGPDAVVAVLLGQ